MGRSRMMTFVLHTRATMPDTRTTPCEWKVKQSGKPTQDNITKWVKDFEDSLRPNGINDHLGIFSITQAWVVDQRNNEIVCRWKRPPSPLFVVIEPLPEDHPLHKKNLGYSTTSRKGL